MYHTPEWRKYRMSLISTMFESLATGRRPTISRDPVNPSTGISSQGVQQDPFTTLFTNLPCSINETSPSVIDLFAQRNTNVKTTLYFAQDPGLEVDDRVDVTSMSGTISKCLVRGRASAVGRDVFWTVDVERVAQSAPFTQSKVPL